METNSKQLWNEMKKAQRDIGMIRNYPTATKICFMSTQSLTDYENWDTNTEGVDISAQAQLAERAKESILNVDPAAYDVTLPGGVLARALTTLASGDVVASHDYVYMFLVTPTPKFFVRPVFSAPDGSRLQMIQDESAAYDDNSFRVKVRYRENYKMLDVRGLIIGDITRS